MSKNLSMITKNIGRKLKKHSPEILTGIGIAGMISATVMAVRATPKALQNIEHEKILKIADQVNADAGQVVSKTLERRAECN